MSDQRPIRSDHHVVPVDLLGARRGRHRDVQASGALAAVLGAVC
jgi:hypothetical protein